jgi:hypothetical protein
MDAAAAFEELPPFLERIGELVAVNQARPGWHGFQEAVVERR